MNFRLLLLPFSFLYAAGARFRNLLFDTGILKQQKFPVPIILVGNLSVGGTGKTPHVEYLLSLLHNDFRLATISRGYGRNSSGFVMAGKGSTASLIGDEPMQYHSKFENVTVAVCENRVEGIQKLMELKKPQVIVMDDGYQHRHVNPGLKILLTPVDRPFVSDFLLPAGDLREPRSAYQRADIILLTRTSPGMNSAEKEAAKNKIQPLPHQHLFFSSLEYGQPAHFFNHTKLTPAELSSKHVLLFSGIAGPGHLETYLKNNTSGLDSVKFPDHHNYNRNELTLLREKFDKFAGGSGIILTTEKDFQRLRGTDLMNEFNELPIYYIPIKIKIDNQENFNKIIRNYVETNKGNS